MSNLAIIVIHKSVLLGGFESYDYIKLHANLNATAFSVTIVEEHNNTSYCING